MSSTPAAKRGIDGKKRKKPVQVTIFTAYDDNGQPIGILVRNGFLVNHFLVNLPIKDQNIGGIEVKKLSRPAVVTFMKEMADKPLPATPVFKAWAIVDTSDEMVNGNISTRWQKWQAYDKAIGRVLENAQGNGKGSVFDYYSFTVTYEDHTLIADEAERLFAGVLDSEAFRSRMTKIVLIDLDEEEEDARAEVCF